MNDHAPPPVFDRRLIIPELACEPRASAGAVRLELSGAAFATTWKVSLLVDSAQAGADFAAMNHDVRARIDAVLAEIDVQMNPFRADSDISRFNRAEAWHFVPLPALMMQVMRHALEMAQISDGAFDPTLMPATELWGFGPRAVAEGLPEANAVKDLQAQTRGWRDLVWQDEGFIRPEGVKLDLCAIAKGFAVDRVMAALREVPGACAALVEIGGELKGWGVQADGLPWWVEIEASNTPTRIAPPLIALCDWAVATSGEARRSFIHEDVIYSHTMDTRTKAPTRSGVVSATVLDPQCWRADAYATILMVLPLEQAMAFAEHHDIACCLTVREAERHRQVFSPLMQSWS
jgi:FAD:protein FMN transferase